MSLFPPHVQSHFTKPCVQSAVGWNERRERANLLRWHTIRNTQSEADICCKRGKKSPLKSQNQSPFHAAISLPKLLQQALLLSSQSINQTIYPIKTVTVLSRCRHFQFRTSKLNVQAIRKVQGGRTPHPAETAARLQTEPCKQKPLSRDWYKAADMWASLLMQPPGLKAMPIFSSPLLLHKVRIDEKGVDPVESNDGQGNVMGGRNPFFSVVNVQMVVPSILAGTHPKYFCYS